MKLSTYKQSLKWLLALPLVTLVACHSGWDKDAFADQPETIKNGVHPDLDQKGTPPLQGVLFIDVDPSYTIKEGQELNIEIKGRSAHPDFRIDRMAIKDLEEVLPGATFDEQTSQLNYKIEDGSFPDGILFYSRELTISLFAEYEGLLHEMRQTMTVNVLRGSAQDPKIIRVEGLKKNLKEGEINHFKIFVRDSVSPNGPNINIVKNDRTSARNGSQYVDFKSIAYPVPNESDMWFFEASLRLDKNGEITSDFDNFNFIIKAYSVFGVPSLMNRQSFRVYTKAEYPHFFMHNKVNATVGEAMEYTFSVVDLRREGEINAEFADCSTFPGATCVCREIVYGSARDSATCTLKWTPQAAGTYRTAVTARNEVNSNTPFEDFRDTKSTLTVNVKNGGAVQ